MCGRNNTHINVAGLVHFQRETGPHRCGTRILQCGNSRTAAVRGEAAALPCADGAYVK
jgi:hypothetical protein